MDFPSPMIEGTLVQRYKRFLADVKLQNGEVVTAHCANSGSLFALKSPGSKVWISKVPDHAERKLRYDWQLIEDRGALVCINTSLPNKIVAEALKEKAIPHFQNYTSFRPEVPYGLNSRIDFLLEGPDLPPLYLEVKSVNHRDEDAGVFPDAVTTRGQKQLAQMTDLLEGGMRAAVLYVVVRNDCKAVSLAHHIDPDYVKEVSKAKEKGVDFWAFDCNLSPTSIKLGQELIVRDH